MRYAFTSFSAPQSSLAELVELALRYGYAGLEPRVGAGHGHGLELTASRVQRRELCRQIRDAGLELVCLATSGRYSDPATATDEVETTLRALDLAADVGAARVKVFCGPLPPGVGRDAATASVVGSLRALADEAQAQGVKLCVETHDDWSNPEVMAGVLRAVDHPAVAAIWDIMHTLREGGAAPDEAVRALRPWLDHVHVHDGLLRRDRLEFRPIGEGEVDHRRPLDLLREVGYAGFLSGEWLDWEPPEVHLPREIAALRRLEGEPG